VFFGGPQEKRRRDVAHREDDAGRRFAFLVRQLDGELVGGEYGAFKIALDV
jgi:hypothetical protein